MPWFNRSNLLALCVWEASVVGSLVVTFALSSSHIWGKDDIEGILELAICGLFVVAGIVLLRRRFERLSGVLAGLLCGLAPSAVIVVWVLLSRPGFEGSAGGVASATMLAAP